MTVDQGDQKESGVEPLLLLLLDGGEARLDFFLGALRDIAAGWNERWEPGEKFPVNLCAKC